jgi:hypothetical protein
LAEPDRGAEAVPEAANDASRGSAGRTRATGALIAGRIKDSGPLGWLLLALGLAASVLLVVADFSTISYRTIGIGACPDRAGASVCRTSGHESHAFALVILAPIALIMAWGAVVGRSRAAALSLCIVGAAVLLIALAIDLPKLHDRRNLNALYDDVAGHTGSAFKLELVAGVLLVLVGGLALGRPEPRAKRPERRRPRAATEVAPEPQAEPVAVPPEPPPPAPAPREAGPAAEPEARATPRPRPKPKPKPKAKPRGKGSAKPRAKSTNKQRRPRRPSTG